MDLILEPGRAGKNYWCDVTVVSKLTVATAEA